MRTRPDTIIVRHVNSDDAAELADMLNAIIVQGGTTALEDPFTPDALNRAYLTGPDVYCCFVAVDPQTRRIEGFQTLGRLSGLPRDIGDIGTFARIGGTKRGVGSALFIATCDQARQLGLIALNATIRADNLGGLAFYGKLGFEDQGVIEGKPLKAGTAVDRIVKRYPLT